MKSNKSIIWVGWENHRRNASISSALGIDLYEFNEAGGRFKRYWVSVLKTFKLFRREKPKVVVCQNPSLVLTLFCMVYKFFFNIVLVVDMHNAGLGEDTESRILKKISLYIQKNVDLNIVTNQTLADMVVKNGGKAFILPDKIPKIDKPSSKYQFSHKINILFICTYARDEPYLEVFEASEKLNKSGKDIGVYVTGKIPSSLKKENLASNIHLLGFVSWEVYDQLLYSCDGIIDLTLMDSCLVCGGYEALAFNKPILLSDSRSSTEYFGSSACYTDNTVDDIVTKTLQMCESLEEYETKQKDQKKYLDDQWELMRKNLMHQLTGWQ